MNVTPVRAVMMAATLALQFVHELAVIRSGLSSVPNKLVSGRINTVESFQRNVTLLHRREATIRQSQLRAGEDWQGGDVHFAER